MELMSDADRLAEVGQIMAFGALRMLRNKNAERMRKELDSRPHSRITVRDEERFAGEKRLSGDTAKASLN